MVSHQDMEISVRELRTILNRVVSKRKSWPININRNGTEETGSSCEENRINTTFNSHFIFFILIPNIRTWQQSNMHKHANTHGSDHNNWIPYHIGHLQFIDYLILCFMSFIYVVHHFLKCCSFNNKIIKNLQPSHFFKYGVEFTPDLQRTIKERSRSLKLFLWLLKRF